MEKGNDDRKVWKELTADAVIAAVVITGFVLIATFVADKLGR